MQVWFKPNWYGLNRRFDVIEWRETDRGEQPAVADNDEAEDGAVHRMGVLVLACRVCFATGPRELAFVRGLRPTKAHRCWLRALSGVRKGAFAANMR